MWDVQSRQLFSSPFPEAWAVACLVPRSPIISRIVRCKCCKSGHGQGNSLSGWDRGHALIACPGNHADTRRIGSATRTQHASGRRNMPCEGAAWMGTALPCLYHHWQTASLPHMYHRRLGCRAGVWLHTCSCCSHRGQRRPGGGVEGAL